MRLFLFLSLGLLFPFQLFSFGTNGGNILTQSYSAKSQGMGESYTALSAAQGDVTSFQYNPSALAALSNKEGSVTYKLGSFGDSFGVFSYGSPLTLNKGTKRMGSYAATFLYYTFGDLEYLNAAGTPVTVNAQKDIAFILSYGFNLWPTLSVGANGKILNSEIAESFKATTFALDLGTQLKIGPGTSLGFSLLNVGTGLKYDQFNSELPVTFRMGLANEYQWTKLHNTLVALDVIKRRDEPIRNNVGVQYTFDDGSIVMSARVGYRFNQDTGKLNFGLGIPFKKYKFDYSSQVIGGIGLSHFFTLGYLF